MYDRLGDILSQSLESGILNKKGKSDAKKASEAQVLEVIIPDSIRQNLKILELEQDATYTSAKKAFHEKLKEIHPDTRNEKSSEKKAGVQTEKLLADWHTIDSWYEKNQESAKHPY